MTTTDEDIETLDSLELHINQHEQLLFHYQARYRLVLRRILMRELGIRDAIQIRETTPVPVGEETQSSSQVRQGHHGYDPVDTPLAETEG